MTRTKFAWRDMCGRFLLGSVVLVLAGCASTPEGSTEVDAGVATTGEGGNFRLLRNRDMANVREESARVRDARRAADEAEAKAAAEEKAEAEAKSEAGQAKEDAASEDENPEDDSEPPRS